ncbi:MAG TPA: urease accessory UreF family protein [Capsulimonadaceae bacterium]|jgi:urease accessory protein
MSNVAYLQLMQLADSATPIGSAAHSFGLEGLIEEQGVGVSDLEAWLHDYLAEAGRLDASFCRDAFELVDRDPHDWTREWVALNGRVAATKPAREGRAASATLGRRFLAMAATLSESVRLRAALDACASAKCDVHHSASFGLVGRELGLPVQMVVETFGQQTVMAMVSACQRLLPIGQSQASRLLWDLKSAIVYASAEGTERLCFTPLLEIASMRHPDLPTRLFIS